MPALKFLAIYGHDPTDADLEVLASLKLDRLDFKEVAISKGKQRRIRDLLTISDYLLIFD